MNKEWKTSVDCCFISNYKYNSLFFHYLRSFFQRNFSVFLNADILKNFILYWNILELIYNVLVLVSESESHSVMSDSLRPHELYSPWNSPGQNTGLGSLFLLQGIFLIQGSNPDLPHCRRILYQLSHQF